MSASPGIAESASIHAEAYGEIHPLAIRYPGIEPCIPIKLTRIAAVDDMAIRAFFLGDNRVAPTNWPPR